ncbi:MAG: hypothetical protein ACR2HH_03160 [Chthoniobacterales bacterium]
MKLKTLLTISSLALALNFAPAAFAQTPEQSGQGRHGRNGRHAQFMASLSPDERARLKAAHQKAMADPTVQAAKDRTKTSRKEFREMRRAAMLKADPSIQPILDKMPARGRKTS